MKHIIKVNNIQDAKDNRIRPLIAMDNSGVLFSRGPVPKGFVDFGLPSGTLWSTKNIGATNGDTAESWYGNYYAWGEIETKTNYDWPTYKYAKGNERALTKYCNNSNYGNNGFTDELIQLVPEDDADTITNSAWRMPTYEDFNELLAGTINSWETNYKGVSGLNGRVFTKARIIRPAFKNIPLYSPIAEGETGGTTNEINDELWAVFSLYTLEELNTIFGVDDTCIMIFKNKEMTVNADYNTDYGFIEKEVDPSVSMFIPAAGFRYGSDIHNVGSRCSLWSSSLYLDNPSSAYDLYFDSGNIGMGYYNRYFGFSVRPVC